MAVAVGSSERADDPRARQRAFSHFAQRLVTEASVTAITLWSAFFIGSLLILCTLTNPLTIIREHGLSLQTLGLLLHRIVNPIVMGLLFYGTILPTGLVMRLRGRDLLRLRRDPAAETYWITRTPGPAPETMRDQF